TIRQGERIVVKRGDRKGHEARFRQRENRPAVRSDRHLARQVLRQLQSQRDQQIVRIVQQEAADVRSRRRVLHRGNIKGRIEGRAIRRKNTSSLVLLRIKVVCVSPRERERGVSGVLLGEDGQGVGLE